MPPRRRPDGACRAGGGTRNPAARGNPTLVRYQGEFGGSFDLMHPAEAHPALARLHPMGRMGETSDIVEGVMSLETAHFVTGEVLHVDGGQAAGHHALQ